MTCRNEGDFIALDKKGFLNLYPVRIGTYTNLDGEQDKCVTPVAFPRVYAFWYWLSTLVTRVPIVQVTSTYIPCLYVKKEDILDDSEPVFI